MWRRMLVLASLRLPLLMIHLETASRAAGDAHWHSI